MVRALLARAPEPFDIGVVERELAAPGLGELLVETAWSSLNYKDALAVTGAPGILRSLPMVPGIDLVGTVTRSEDPAWAPGDRLLVNGRGLGEQRDGGYTDAAVIPSALASRVPDGLLLREAAAVGTAGFTAALSVLALEAAGLPEGPVLVTGATGGVGAIAIALLAARGHRVVAATGRPQHAEWLIRLGAGEVVDRAELQPGRPLQSERWAGAVDVAGGGTLAAVLAQLRYGGAVAASGLADAARLESSVMPFILRGVRLLGVNSVFAPEPQREAAWAMIDTALDRALLAELTTELELEQVPSAAAELLAGRRTGRAAVRLAGEPARAADLSRNGRARSRRSSDPAAR